MILLNRGITLFSRGFNAAHKFFGHLPGGLAIATIGACGIIVIALFGRHLSWRNFVRSLNETTALLLIAFPQIAMFLPGFMK